MTTTEIVLSIAVAIEFIWLLNSGSRLRAVRGTLHDRVSALAQETKQSIEKARVETLYIAKNAQGIASNALSSAQRAEAKIFKHTEVKTEEKANA